LNINSLYKLALGGAQAEENRLFHALAVRFRVFAAQRIRNDDDINDIVQNTLMAILKYYKTTEIEVSFQAWAYKILDRQIMDFLNKRKGLELKEDQFRERMSELNLSEKIDVNDLKYQLLKCLRKIYESNPRFARILNMHYQGYNTKEICEFMKISSANFYTILRRARSLLIYCLEKGDVE
jgi:RNA polymerase sigma factor (sigma-70 family)